MNYNAMPGPEDFNAHPHNPAIDPELAAKGHASIEEDAQPFLKWYDRLLEAEVERLDQIPTDAVPLYNHDATRDPYDPYYLEYLVMQQLGYKVHLADYAPTKHDRQPPTRIAVRVEAPDDAAVREIEQAMDPDNHNNSKAYLTNFLEVIGSQERVESSTPEDTRCRVYGRLSDSLAGLPKEQSNRLLGQGFMTTQMRKFVKVARHPSYSPILPDDADAAKYQELREQGHRVIDREGLLGMAFGSILAAIRENNIPSPANPPTPKGQPFTAGRTPGPGADDYYPY